MMRPVGSTARPVNDRNQVTATSGMGSATLDANGNLIWRFNSAGPNGLTCVYG